MLNNMKKIYYIVITVICFCMLTACGNVQNEGTSIEVYYLTKNADAIEEVAGFLKTSTIESQIEEIKSMLETTPEDGRHIAVLGIDFNVRTMIIEEKNLILSLDPAYRKLDPIKRVLARAALVRSFCQVDGIDYVSMEIDGEALTDDTGVPFGAMSGEDFIFNTGDEINTYEKVKLKLYLANSNGDGLVETSKVVVYNTNISMDKLVVEQILIGGDGVSCFSTVSPETKLINVSTMDGTCYVNLNEGFLQPYGTVTAQVSVYSLVNSLTELPNVNRVQLMINGEQAVMYKDSISLEAPIERKLEIVEQR